MTASPAAAAIAEPRCDRLGIPERLGALLGRCDPGAGRALAERLLPATTSSVTGRRPDADRGFSWLRIPRSLAAGFGLDATPPGRVLLEDLCWLQYCVYAVFRIQDDLVDGECDDPTLGVQTNTLLVEAAHRATDHFAAGSPFWQLFQDSVDATSRAILTLRRLQRSTDRDPGEELRLYAELSASLKIATAGVALAAGRDDAWRQLSPALDAFWVAAQIVDDLRDVRDDLDAGAINHAAWFLSHPVFSSSAEAIAAVVASNLATTDRLERLLDRAGAPMDRALAGLDRELCPAVYDHLADYRRGLVDLAGVIRQRASRLSTAPAGRG